MIYRVNDFYRELGGRLKQARGPLSQTEVARRADLNRMSVANIELGRQRVAVDILVRLADAVNVEPAELLRGIRPGGDPAEHLGASERRAVDRIRIAAGLARDPVDEPG
jgi:transcriptional regulator with XRE-family HTH domain